MKTVSKPETSLVKELSEPQKKFCIEYLKDFSATAAAERAGYSPASAKTTGPRLLANVGVQIYLRQAIDKATKGAEASIRRVIEELEMIAFSDIKDLVDLDDEIEHYDESGQKTKKKVMRLKSTEKMGVKSRMIQEITEDETLFSVKRKVKLWNKMEALQMLGKYHRMFVESIELSNPDGKLQPIVQIYLPDNGRDKK